jgi:hypothetical protein
MSHIAREQEDYTGRKRDEPDAVLIARLAAEQGPFTAVRQALGGSQNAVTVTTAGPPSGSNTAGRPSTVDTRCVSPGV